MSYQGKWALVTGASAGIGAAFARALAAKGANLILTARRLDRLDALAAELSDKHQSQCLTIAADLSEPDAPQKIFDAIAKEGRPVDILINNAGFGMPGVYTDNSWADHRAYLELMTISYAHLTRLFIPGMQERGYGRIIQVASVAGLIPGSAGHTLYGATKAFLVSFAQSIAAENLETGVHCSALCPGFTYSEFHDVNDTRPLVSQLPKYMFMDAEPVVEGALAAVDRGHVVYVPGGFNKFLTGFSKALPRPWAAAMVRRQSKSFRRQQADA